MPTIRITTLKPRRTEQAATLATALSACISAVLGVPEKDNWIVQESPGSGYFSTGEAGSEDYAVVTIEMFPGRAIEKKRALYAGIAAAFEAHGTPGQNLRIVVLEVPPENWGIYGGQAASDIFKKS